MTELQKGQKAPEFSLKTYNNEIVNLTDFKGRWVVLYFYPKALTPGCTTQACGIRDIKQELEEKNIIVLGISPDDPEKLTQFKEKKDLNFTLLSDPDKEVAQKYDVWKEKKLFGKISLGIKRTTFIIDPNGDIGHIMKTVKTKTHHEDIIKVIEKLREEQT